jgi:transcriptional regulator GlxA family with amidase domain
MRLRAMTEALAVLSVALDLRAGRLSRLYDRRATRHALGMGRARREASRLFLVRRDEQVQKAIELMHADLAARWTVTSLARRVGLSRPAFARRFVASTGLSPRRYLTRCRMQRAALLLRDTDASLAVVGARIGYGSEFAFNRAFKRAHLKSPGVFRRESQRSALPVFRAAA